MQHKNLKKQFYFMAAAVMLIAAMNGCSPPDKNKPVESITINPSGDVSIRVGETTTLSATVMPTDATDNGVTWSSSNTSAATVNAQTGAVTGVSVGTTTIRASSVDGSGVSASKNVTVLPVVIGGITIAPSGDVSIIVGQTTTLTATVTPDNATNKSVTWSSLNTNIATVNAQTGVVTGVIAGTATIRATAADGSGVSATKTVTVLPKTISIGAQNGTLTASTAGSVTFAVTTANIANGQAGTITWYTTSAGTTTTNAPAGITASVSNVANNAATVTVNATSAVVSGDRYFRVTIDGIQSAVVTLRIGILKTVTVAQSGSLIAGRVASTTFSVTTTNIANGQAGTVTWYTTSAGTTTTNAPTGITASVSNVASNAATVTVNATASSTPGTYYFRVTIDGILSNNVATLNASTNEPPWNIGHPGYNSNVVANLSGNTLTISGTGNMVDFWNSTEGEAPWWFNPTHRNAIRTIVIQNGVTNIGNRAFKDLTNLQTITIANSVTIIGRRAFDKCTSLETITIPSSVAEIEGEAFFDCSKLHTVTLSNGSGQLRFTSFYYGGSEYPRGDKYGWFEGCIALKTLHLGRNLANWYSSSSVYSPVSNIITPLTSITIGSTVNTIGTYAFANCNNLSNVTIENGTTALSFSYTAFDGSNNIQIVHLGRNLSGATPGVGFSLFIGKTRLSTLTIGNNVTAIGDDLFRNCSGLTSPVAIPNSVETIGNYAFSGCERLQTVTIGTRVQTIGERAFENCRALTAITIPSSVNSIGTYAFANCNNLSNVTIENGSTTLSFGYTGFDGSNNIQTVHLGRNLSGATPGVGFSLFIGKTRLSTLTIGNNVTAIGDDLFRNCSGLTQITSNRTSPPTIQSNTFNGVTRSIPVRVPSSAVSAYRAAQHWNQFTNFQSM